MASFHLDHLKNYHRRFCRPSRAPNIPTKQGQNMLEILQDCFEEQIQANEVHQKILSTDVVSKSTPDSTKTSSKGVKGHHGASDELYLPGGSPVVLLGARVSGSQKAISSGGQKRVTSRRSADMQSSNTDIPFKTRKRLNFEDKVISNTAEIESSASQVEDSISEEQEGTSSETSQKRDDLSSEIQPQSKKSFSELYLETVNRKSKCSSVVRHTAAVPSPPYPPNDMKLLEDEFIIDGPDRSFSSQPWVVIPRKGHHMPFPENIAVPQGKKSREKPHRLSEKTLVSNTQTDKTGPVEEAQLSVEEKLGTTLTNEVENDCRSTENKTHSENAKKPSARKRTVKQKQRRPSKPNVAQELSMGQNETENRNMSKIGQDKLQINSKRNMEDHEEVRNEPTPKKPVPALGNKKEKDSTQANKEKSRKKCFSRESKRKSVPKEVTLASRRGRRTSQHPSEWWLVKPSEGSVDGNSSKENESSILYPNRKKQTKRNHVSENTEKKPVPSKRKKKEISSRELKSLNVKGSGGNDDISTSQRKPLQNIDADPTQKSLHCSGPTRGSEDQNSDMISQNVHLKTRSEQHRSKTQMESTSNSEVCKHSVWEESGPSRFKNLEMPGRSNSEVGDEKDQKSLDLKTRSSNMVPNRNLHHKLVLPSNSPNVRRSNRIRLKPLEYWRGERIDYQESSSGRLVLEIVSPASESVKRKAKRNLDKVNKETNKKRIHLDNPTKTKIKVSLDIPLGDPFQATLAKDPETREIVPMDLIRPRDTYHFFVEQHGLKVYKTLNTTFFSTGKLVLGPHEEKGKQHVGQDILVFYVNFGDLLCTLHETPYMLTTGDSFYVPSGNHYNIKNLLNVESCLLFTQIKR
uniref:Centromere protein C n=1 Tax=Rattus norvegicus TaxID=10116 RepID=A0A8I6ACV2_RAT